MRSDERLVSPPSLFLFGCSCEIICGSFISLRTVKLIKRYGRDTVNVASDTVLTLENEALMKHRQYQLQRCSDSWLWVFSEAKPSKDRRLESRPTNLLNTVRLRIPLNPPSKGGDKIPDFSPPFEGYRVYTSRSQSYFGPLNPPILILLANLTNRNMCLDMVIWGL